MRKCVQSFDWYCMWQIIVTLISGDITQAYVMWPHTHTSWHTHTCRSGVPVGKLIIIVTAEARRSNNLPQQHRVQTLHCTNSTQTSAWYMWVCVTQSKQDATGTPWSIYTHLHAHTQQLSLAFAFAVAFVNPWDTSVYQMCILGACVSANTPNVVNVNESSKEVISLEVGCTLSLRSLWRFWSTSHKRSLTAWI